jgi:hypothetical protein
MSVKPNNAANTAIPQKIAVHFNMA